MIVVVPDVTPVTTPEVDDMVAIAELPGLHVPPVVASLSVVIRPAQALAVPVILAGATLTVIALVAVHPEEIVYTRLNVPVATPVTIPVEEPTVAFVVLLLDHVPPEAVSVKAIVVPTQAIAEPEIEDGME